jgi:glycosyltransferase involved in cell wall biosynthesis
MKDHKIPSQKIALVHDSFFIKGGAERMNIEIANILEADIVSTVVSAGSYNLESLGFEGRVRELLPSFGPGVLKFLKMKWRFATAHQELSEYSLVFLSNEAITAWRSLTGYSWWGLCGTSRVRKVYYAHSISRHLYDQQAQYLGKVNILARPLASIVLWGLRQLYESDLRHMDIILTNSASNAMKLRALAPTVPVQVLHPFVDTRVFNPGVSDASARLESTARSQDLEVLWSMLNGAYHLSYARLAHAKRIDVIILAFRELPSQKLLVVYGKNDPQREEFMLLARGYSNIMFHTLEDNSLLPSIVAWAQSVIYISHNEDFGMNTIESLACGVPVIAVAEGGFLETMVDGETGVLLAPDFTRSDLKEAVLSLTPERILALRESCIARAQLFSLEHFTVELKKYLAAVGE